MPAVLPPTGAAAPPSASPPALFARDIVVIASSTGGLTPTIDLLAALPPHFPAAVVLVQHRSPDHADLLPQLLRARTVLPVHTATNGERLRPGHVYVATPDRQVLITPYRTIRTTTPGETGWPLRRGTADPLFASAAATFGERAIAVVLSGHLDDGVRGAEVVKRHGGRVLVQDPRTATVQSMPVTALATGSVDFALPPRSLAHVVTALLMIPGARDLFRVEREQLLIPVPASPASRSA